MKLLFYVFFCFWFQVLYMKFYLKKMINNERNIMNIKKDALKLIENKAKKNNNLSLIDIWDIELELEANYKFVKENEIKKIVEDIIFYK